MNYRNPGKGGFEIPEISLATWQVRANGGQPPFSQEQLSTIGKIYEEDIKPLVHQLRR